ncbi:OmpA family protein [Halosquirtibacter xylanolyticus]|uniref:PorE family type IX secretion system protein n=1 Tax=Halosquirtibacter xylanolyticus TaxID=3374599 RepID=UPI00374907CA|nr:OmpA family protein [Prolixibacteraceae bacterium]
MGFTKNLFFKQAGRAIMAFSLLFTFSNCQLSSLIKKANRSKENGEYHKAAKLFTKAASKSQSKEQRGRFFYETAQNYHRIGDYRKASAFYKRALTYKYNDSTLLLTYGDMLCGSGKYEKAIETYETFLQANPKSKVAKEKIRMAKLAPEWIQSKSRVEIKKMKEINSKGSDIAAIYPTSRSNYLVFSSNNPEIVSKKKSSITGEQFYDLCYANFNIQRQRWEKPVTLDPNMIINGPEDEAVTSFTSQGSVIYYTKCQYNKAGKASAVVYKSRVDGDQWAKPEPVMIPNDSIMVAHPSITLDGKELYFVSDRPGGYGGNDIWVAKNSNGKWGRATNLGPQINTPGNETYPFIRDNGELYFSSDTHIGIGGLDIFKAIQNEDGVWEVENARSPINSSEDDFAITFLAGKEQGLFTSNRKGTRSDDIFSFIIPAMEFTIEGHISNKKTQEPISNATVRIIGTQGTMLKLKSRNGKYSFNIKKDEEYLVAAYKKGFLNAKYLFNTLEAKESIHLNTNLALTPTDAPISVDNIYFDLAKWDLLPQSKTSLDQLYQILIDNPTIAIEIMAHTDARGDQQSNFTLSQKRAQSVVSYLKAKGIQSVRLTAKGYGKTSPKVVDTALAEKYDFLKEGEVLTMENILKMDNEQQEICHQINRRTEFRVISTNYLKK